MLGDYLPEPLRTWWIRATAIQETWGVLRWLASLAALVGVAMVWLWEGSDAAAGLASLLVATVAVFFGMTFYGWTRGWNMPTNALSLLWRGRAESERKRHLIDTFYKMVDEVEDSYRAQTQDSRDETETIVCRLITKKSDFHRLAPYLSDRLRNSIALEAGPIVHVNQSADETLGDAILRATREEIAQLEREWKLI